jgi:hypothetical protein
MRMLMVAGAVLVAATGTVAQPMQLTGTFNSTKLYAKPGQTLNSTFQLTLDPTYHPTVFHSTISDFYHSEDGKQSYYPPAGTVPHSCGKWVTLNPIEKRINPGDKLDVRLTVAVPAGTAPGGYWCELNVDQLPDPVDENTDPNGETQVHISFLASISTGIFVFVQPLQRSAQVVSVDVSSEVASVRLINDGNTPLAVEGRFEFSGEPLTAGPVKVPLPRTTVFLEPENRAIISVPLPPPDQLPSGPYIVRLVLDIGLDHLIGVQRRIELQRVN